MVGQILLIMVPFLLSVAYLTYAERKVIAAMQRRKGPNVVGLVCCNPLQMRTSAQRNHYSHKVQPRPLCAPSSPSH